MKEQAVQTLESEGASAAIDLLKSAELSPTEYVPLFSEVFRHAYWQQKDLSAAIQIGQAGIRLGENLAESHPDLEEEILAQVKAIHYDLASFTWPGWDEEGLEITPEQVELGLTSARENLDLAIQLKKPPLPVSRAYWMLGAQHIAAGQFVQAQARFDMAERNARDAGSKPDELLAKGFYRVAALLDKPGNERLLSGLEHIKTALLEEEHGEFFVKQIEDALRIFGG